MTARSINAGCPRRLRTPLHLPLDTFLTLWNSSRLAQFAFLFLIALLTRAPTFGEWNYDVDDQFYFLVGHRLLAGDTLYVDIWDRKGPLLYLLYAGFAAVSPSAAVFQLAAALSAALGATGINALTRLVSGPRQGLIAATAYLALICFFGGASGQTPVFYNTLMIAAAWAISSRIEQLRNGRVDAILVGGVGCASLAIAIKQSAVVEAAFFGGYITWNLLRSGIHPIRITFSLFGFGALAFLPWVLVFAWYGHHDQIRPLWQALVESNVRRQYDSALGRILRLLILCGQLILPLVFGVIGGRQLYRESSDRAAVIFIALWATVAMLAVISFPIVYSHYALPILPPLCILASAYFARERTGALVFAAMVTVALVNGGTLNLPQRWQAHKNAAELVAYAKEETPRGKLLVWGIPSYLYVLLDTSPPSVLAFPPHFFQGDESGVSGIDEIAELQRILAARPETVIVQDPILTRPLSEQNMAAVARYVKTCSQVRRFVLYDHNGEQPQIVYSRCAG